MWCKKEEKKSQVDNQEKPNANIPAGPGMGRSCHRMSNGKRRMEQVSDSSINKLSAGLG
jgi:hypothetical protein